MMLARADIEIRLGSNIPAVTWELDGEDGQPLDMSGRDFALTISWSGGSIYKNTKDNAGFIVEVGRSALTYTPSLSESLEIPASRVAEYKIEIMASSEQFPIIWGTVTGVGMLD